MLFEHNDYRSYLKRVLAERIARNPSYSLRAFARQLSLHHSMLGAVFKNQKRFSRERAPRIASSIGLTGPEHEYFCLLVELDSTKNVEQRSRILARLSAFRKAAPVYDLSVDHFEVISNWYHFPILQMIGEPSFSQSSEAIADRLGIHVVEAEAAVERLERLECIERDPETGRFRKTNDSVRVHSTELNQALVRFHVQMMEKAAQSMNKQAPQERIVQTQTIAFDQAQLKAVDELTDEYVARVVQLADTGSNRDQIYHLNTVFFNLTPANAGARNDH